ncbi:hypothetical protein FQN49_000260 [Arthroderma sp. PD_2]|nr:hypothetical protein FQN49_000260 [Arthroderma sp. PD_2]
MSADIIKFPVDRQAWTSLVKKHDLGTASIHQTRCVSASKISETQYLLLRSFWVSSDTGPKKDPKEWGIRRIDEAKKWFDGNGDWQIYIQNLSPKTLYPVPPPGLGTFSYAWLTQRQVTKLPHEYEDEEGEDKNVSFSPIASRLRSSDNRQSLDGRKTPDSPSEAIAQRKGFLQISPSQSSDDSNDEFHAGNKGKGKEKAGDSDMNSVTGGIGNLSVGEESVTSEAQSTSDGSRSIYKMSPGSSRRAFPKVEDEQIVNGFLIALLVSICMYNQRQKSNGDGEKPFLFEARTDGHLAPLTPGRTGVIPSAIIVEVKPTYRRYNNRVIYQATSQMAAWIFEEPDVPGTQQPYRRAMILQERHEIRLVISKYDQNYIDYLHGKPDSNSEVPLLEMHELRTWDIEEESDMKRFGPILLALALQNGKLEY